jgi:hypothetical protein
MGLNTNHTFEELGTVRCSIVEKNCSASRVQFLKELLEHNGFSVIVVKSPPPKAAAKPATDDPATPLPETFTVGVTDLSFNVMNAIYNRELKTTEGTILDPYYWKQLHSPAREQEWYWKN